MKRVFQVFCIAFTATFVAVLALSLDFSKVYENLTTPKANPTTTHQNHAR